MWNPNPSIATPVRDGGQQLTYSALDLSSVIGAANRYLVKLAFTTSNVVNVNVGVRPGDNSDDLFLGSATSAQTGCQEGRLNTNKAVSVYCVTSGSSIIDFITSASTLNIQTYLQGWADVTAFDPARAGVAHELGKTIGSAGWTDLDFSPEIGSIDALLLLQGRYVSGSANNNRKCAFKPSDDGTDVLNDNSAVATGGPAVADVRFSASADMTLLVPTGPTGIVKGTQSAFTSVLSFWIHALVEGWVRSDTGVFYGAPPTAYAGSDLDLSPVVGARSCLVLLKIIRPGGAGVGNQSDVSFRRKGDTLDYQLSSPALQGAGQIINIDATEAAYLAVDTDSAGVVEWMANTASYSLSVSVVGFIPGGTPPSVLRAVHVSPRCVRVDFDMPMRNNADLRDPSNYSLTGGSGATVTAVRLPWVHRQEYVSSTVLGGLPESVYLITDRDIDDAGVTTVSITTPAGPVSFYDGIAISALGASASLTTYETAEVAYYNSPGLKVDEGTRELAKTGRAKYTIAQPTNYGIVNMIEKLADLVSGGQLSTIETALDGPPEDEDATFLGSGFSVPGSSVPNIGDTITFGSDGIPYHVDRLWGSCDGVNELFRATSSFHSFCCAVIKSTSPLSSAEGGELELVDWYTPNSGEDHLIRLVNPPEYGSSLMAIYVPRKSLIRIDEEIIAYHESDYLLGTGVICGRDQLMTELSAHNSGEVVEDVFMSSLVERGQYNMLVFGASGEPLDSLSSDRGVSRSDNPSLSDTELRRAVFNTAVTQRTVPETVKRAIRYLCPDLWPYVEVGEDPRWPNCITIWYSPDPIRDPGGVVVDPPIEPWETWLDRLLWGDGFAPDTLHDSYYRDPINDTSYEGDYYLSDPTEDPPNFPYPLILSGPDIALIGLPASVIPPPYWVSSSYRSLLVRPKGLDRVLPAGVGVLILDIALTP